MKTFKFFFFWQFFRKKFFKLTSPSTKFFKLITRKKYFRKFQFKKVFFKKKRKKFFFKKKKLLPKLLQPQIHILNFQYLPQIQVPNLPNVKLLFHKYVFSYISKTRLPFKLSLPSVWFIQNKNSQFLKFSRIQFKIRRFHTLYDFEKLIFQKFFKNKLKPLYNWKQNFIFLTTLPKLQPVAAFFKRKFFSNFKYSSTYIIKTKFRPGYQKIWRRARFLFKFFFHLNFKYQHRLTRYLSKLNRFSKVISLFFFECQIWKFLLKTPFFLLKTQFLDFFDCGFIFLNSKQLNSPNQLIQPFDFIQLAISLKYYILYKWWLNQKKIIWMKTTRQYYTYFNKNLSFSLKKKKSTYPKVLLQNLALTTSTPLFFEIDFFSLSCFLLWRFFKTFFTYFFQFKYKPLIYNMYNWKYIT